MPGLHENYNFNVFEFINFLKSQIQYPLLNILNFLRKIGFILERTGRYVHFIPFPDDAATERW